MASLGLTDEFNWFIKRKMTKWGKICFINIKIRLNLWHVNIFYKSITKKVQTPIRLFHKSDSSGEHMCYLGPHMRHRIRGTCLHPCTYKEACHGSFKSMGLCVRQYRVGKISYSSYEDVCAVEILATPLVSQTEKSHPRATEKSSCQS